MKEAAEFDLILLGASGYTGRIAAEYLLERYGSAGELRWAMAGRSADKLAEVRDQIGAPSDIPLIVVDLEDRAAVRAIARRTRLIATTVGPYQLYGSDLVAACAETGTDYVDLCGEANWIRAMIDVHDAEARASGARIMFACGFDCIPFELGVYRLQQIATERFGAPVPRVNTRVRVIKGGFSGGSAATGAALAAATARDPTLIAALADPFLLAPGFTGPPQPPGDSPFDDPDVGRVEPFLLSAINTKIVHRSNLLMGHPYGGDFLYDEMAMVGPDGPVAFDALDSAPRPGEGPSREAWERGRFDLLFIGKAADGRQLRLSVKGDRDPGYGSTAKMFIETALGLLQATDLPGGIWSPGAALRDRLIERLEGRAGISFELEA